MAEKILTTKKPFYADYYRMTGRRYRRGPASFCRIFFKHNLKYMLYLRRLQNNKLKMFKFYYKLRLRAFTKKYGLEISPAAKIGKGLALGHPYNITVHGETVIGNNCNLNKGATVGHEPRGKRKGAPILADRVYVGINSTVVGGINIGEDVLIAPNAFVNFDVPAHSVVIGNPGKIYPKENATVSYVYFLTE